MPEPQPEPWLRGPLENVEPHVMPVFFSFAQVREDLAEHTAGITAAQLWQPVVGKHSLGYHLKHIAGSVDRLRTYLAGDQLSAAQLAFLAHEHTPDSSLPDLLASVHSALDAAQHQVRSIKPDTLFEARSVGRKALPTTVNGLLVHLCEHTQRHLGQAILLSKLLRQG